MTQIEIIDIPPGEAPDWVRKEWVGLIMPVAENKPAKTRSMGVLGGEVENPGGYPVETNTAIQILEEKSPKAAQWWRDNPYLSPMSWLVFKKRVCKLQ